MELTALQVITHRGQELEQQKGRYQATRGSPGANGSSAGIDSVGCPANQTTRVTKLSNRFDATSGVEGRAFSVRLVIIGKVQFVNGTSSTDEFSAADPSA